MDGQQAGALDRWRKQLDGWAIPEEILAAAPESPWGFPVGLFRSRARRAAQELGVADRRTTIVLYCCTAAAGWLIGTLSLVRLGGVQATTGLGTAVDFVVVGLGADAVLVHADVVLGVALDIELAVEQVTAPRGGLQDHGQLGVRALRTRDHDSLAGVRARSGRIAGAAALPPGVHRGDRPAAGVGAGGRVPPVH